MGFPDDPPQPTTDAWDEQEAAVISFEAAWSGGERPRIADFLAGQGPSRRKVLVELVHADLEFRLKRGDAARVETYYADHPELGAEPAVLIDLIRAEWAIRLRREPDLTIDHYRGRFPGLVNGLMPAILPPPEPDDPPPPADPPQPAPAGTERTPADGPLPRRLGKYELRQDIGRGSFGLVFRAWDTVLRRDVAVKIPRPELAGSPTDVLNFLREARNALHLRHPNIVAIHDAGPVDGTVCLISEFIEGMTLAERLRLGPLAVAESVHLMVQVLEALAHAHHRGVVHRDVKPSNILLDRQGVPYLTDFALAKRSAGDSTLSPLGATEVLIGTPAYMAPEQVRGDSASVDARTDVYGAGVVLFELLTGSVPFRGRGRLLQVQIEAADPPGPRQLDDAIPPDLETICLRALAKHPADRYQSASAMADDLANFRAGRPILARRVEAPPTPRPSFLSRHRRGLRRGAVGLVAGLVVGLIGLRWFVLERRVARDSQLIERLVGDSIRAAELPFQGGVDPGDEHRRTSAFLWEGRRAWFDALADRPELVEVGADLLLRSARHLAAADDPAATRAAWAAAIAALECSARNRPKVRERRVDLARAQAALGELEACAGRQVEARKWAELAATTWTNLARSCRDQAGRAPSRTADRLDLAEAVLGADRAARTANRLGAPGGVAEVEVLAEAPSDWRSLNAAEWSRLGIIQLDLARRCRALDQPGPAASWGRQAFRSFESARAAGGGRDLDLLSGRAALLVGLVEAGLDAGPRADEAGDVGTMPREAVDRLGRAVAADPADLDLVRDLATAQAGAATTFARSGQPGRAETWYLNAIDRLEAVRAVRPNAHADLLAEAEVRARLARFEWERGRPRPAIVQALLGLAEAQRAAWIAPGDDDCSRAREAQVRDLIGWLGPRRAPRPGPTEPSIPATVHGEVELH